MKNENRLLTIPQVQKQLQCSRRLVYYLMAQGELPRTKVRRATRISAEVLDAFIERNTVLPDDGATPADDSQPAAPHHPRLRRRQRDILPQDEMRHAAGVQLEGGPQLTTQRRGLNSTQQETNDA